LLLAARADALGAVGRIAVEEIFRWQSRCAREMGVAPCESGGLGWNHRFGESLNLNVHYHLAVADGVFHMPDPDERAAFARLPAPSAADVERILERIHRRVLRWLARKGLLEDESEQYASNDRPDATALEACLGASLGIGKLTTVAVGSGTVAAEPAAEQWRFVPPKLRRGARAWGYDLHAGTAVSARDRLGRERLFRYCARPPLSLERLSVLPDGRIAYRLRRPRRASETHRIMSPEQFLARLVALIPPPRHPLLRYYGAFAPNSPWRSKVVPLSAEAPDGAEPAGDVLAASAAGATRVCASEASTGPEPGCLQSIHGAPGEAARGETTPAPAHDPRHGSAPPSRSDGQEQAAERRIDWATLLRRVYAVDALACPCGGRLRFVALVTEASTARAILESMGLPAEAPTFTRSRDPTFESSVDLSFEM